MTDQHDQLRELVTGAARIVAFTGAGISTECGIPDFRSPGGIWSNNMPIEFDDFLNSPDMRKEAWRRKFRLDDEFSSATPGRGHNALAHLVHTGRASHIITQNIDNLHQASGVGHEQVIELHGNGTYAKCLECGERHELAWVRERFEGSGEPPGCAACGGVVKSATISFGQPMPQHEMTRAEVATLNCDLFLAIGSSLVVFPAAGFPLKAKQNGAGLVIINRDATELDPYADLVLREDIGTVLEPLLDLTPLTALN
jgi:NAD-dependent deacetylase